MFHMEARGQVSASPYRALMLHSYDGYYLLVVARDLATGLTPLSDVIGRPTTTPTPNNEVTTHTYQGLTTTTTNPLNQTGTVVINVLGWTVETRDADGNGVFFEHDAAGRVTATTDPDGNRIETVYDLLGRKTSMTDPDMGTWTYAWDVWGNRRNSDWSYSAGVLASESTRGFTGHEQDDEVGLVNMGARIYDPLLGRFLSPDPTIPDAGNLQSYNRYTYVNNRPLSLTDPSGLAGVPVQYTVYGDMNRLPRTVTRTFGDLQANYRLLGGNDCGDAGRCTYALVAYHPLKQAEDRNLAAAALILKQPVNLDNNISTPLVDASTRRRLYNVATGEASLPGVTPAQLAMALPYIHEAYGNSREYHRYLRQRRRAFRGQAVALALSIGMGQVGTFTHLGSVGEAAAIAGTSTTAGSLVSGADLDDALKAGAIAAAWAAASAASRQLYKEVVGYDIDWAVGQPTLDKTDMTTPVKGYGNVGTQGTRSIPVNDHPGRQITRGAFEEGGWFSRAASHVPLVEPTSDLHDMIQIGAQNAGGKVLRNILNVPTMPVAAGVTLLGTFDMFPGGAGVVSTFAHLNTVGDTKNF